jgi:quercetin dioxygenase-like cupin family protein
MLGRYLGSKPRLVAALGAACALAVCVAAALATPPLNFVSTVLARGTVQRDAPTVDAGRTRAQEAPSDVAFLNVTVQPGGSSGWHSHPGPEIAVVKSGTVTLYYADDPSCTPHQFSAGQGYVVDPNRVQVVRNEGAAAAEFVVAFVVSPGVPLRTDAPNPGNCASRGF